VENIMSSKLFRTRQGTILLGVVAAVLAAIALIVYLNQYRNNANKTAQLVTVLIAAKPIQANTQGDSIANSNLIKAVEVKQSDLQDGAFTSATGLHDQIATTNIAAGDQLTAADFTSSSTGSSVAGYLAKGQRAVVVPLDSPGQVGGQIAPGSQVDVYALITPSNGNPYVREILQNMTVMNSDSSGNVTLQATPEQAGKLIYASGNDKIWLTLRPPRGSVTKPLTITAGSLGG
jgi:Flp pilus assembly protein CpaB